MHRCGSGFLLTLAITFVAALTGCLGKSSSNTGNGGVQSVTLSPGNSITLDVGGTQVFSATGKNANGTTVLGVNIQFVVQSGTPGSQAPLSVASNGNACAGTWDSGVAICSPGIPGIALVTAVINGVSSPPTTVYVHLHVDNVQIQTAESQPPPNPCFSQGQTWLYKGIAYNNNVDITNSVGPMNWTFSNTGVITASSYVPPNQPTVLNQAEITAKAPGITNLFATAGGTTSNPLPLTTCLVQYIRVQLGGQGHAGNSVIVNNGGTVPVTATVVDSLGVTMPSPPLTWSTSDPEIAAFGTTTNTTGKNSATVRSNLGGATLFASCVPPSCNIGLTHSAPAYASDGLVPNGTSGYGEISVDVTLAPNSTIPTYTSWATSTGCQDVVGCTTALFAATSGNKPVGAIVTLPRTPNSMMFNHVASPRLYLGSDQGLMYVNVTGSSPSATLISQSPTPCNVALCGKVLAISNDGNLVVVGDTVSTPGQVYIYNGGSNAPAPIDLIFANPGEMATAATFSPDQLKIFILTNQGNMYVYSTADAVDMIPVGNSANQVAFSADGSFAYVSGTPAGSVSAYSTCSLPSPAPASVNIGSVAVTSVPWEIFPSPVLQLPVSEDGFLWATQNIIAIEPPNIEYLTAQFRQDPVIYTPGDQMQFTCNPPILNPTNGFTKGPSYNLGQGNFTPLYAQLVGYGTQIILVAKNIPAVLIFNVGNGSTTSIPLVNNAAPLAASASSDGSQVFVAACDQYSPDGTTCASGSVHIVNTVNGEGDFQQVSYVNVSENNNRNMCNNGGNPATQCLPNMVAIRPQ